jgi:hypothetical protein
VRNDLDRHRSGTRVARGISPKFAGSARPARQPSLVLSLLLALWPVGCDACSKSPPNARSPRPELPQDEKVREATSPAKPEGEPELRPESVWRARSDIYDIGELPVALTLRWPAVPRIEREVEVATRAQFERASQRSGTRLLVTRSLRGEALVKGSDIEVTMRDGVEIEQLRIDHAQKRIRIRGGRYGGILLSHPAQFYPVKQPRPEWMIEDVIIDGVHVQAPRSAIEAYGRRIAVLNSDIHAQNYSIWSGAVMGIGSEDILIAHNRMSSAGPESTLRLVDVLRSVTVDNTLRNNIKHNYRVHGRSDLAYAARNIFIHTGVMFGTMPGDHLGSLWFKDNTFFHRQNDLFHPGRVARLRAEGNKAHTATFRCFCCERAPAGWQLGKNVLLPYREPPPF